MKLVTLVLVLGVLAIPGFVIYINHEQNQRQDAIAELSARTDARLARVGMALCTFRHDLEERVQGSREFLRTHPHGFLGISPAAIRLGINNQQRTIDALSDLKCAEMQP